MVSVSIFFSFKGDDCLVLLTGCICLDSHAEDGKLMADSESGEFWGCFGGFAPLPRRTVSDDDKPAYSHPPKLLW